MGSGEHFNLEILMKYILIAVALAVLPNPAFAYIDPGPWQMFLQMFVGAVVFAGVVLKIWWTRIKMFLTGKKLPPTSDQDDSSLPK